MEGSLNTISISRLKELEAPDILAYADNLIVTNEIDHLDLFSEPCRVDGVVIFACLEGRVKCNINLQRYALHPGDIIINFTSNIIQVESKGGFKALAALASYDYLSRLQVDLGSKLSLFIGIKDQSKVSLPMGEIEAIKMIFALLRKSMSSKRADSPDIIDGLMQVLARSIISAVRAYGTQMRGEAACRPRRTEIIFERFMNLLSTHHAHERNVSFYAHEMNLSPNYLSGNIRSYSGRSAAEWINEYTVTEAKAMLRFSDMSVMQVSERLSFPSQSAFGKYFKQYVGVSPKEFRKSKGKGKV